MSSQFVMDVNASSKNRYDLSRFIRWTGEMADTLDNRYISELRLLPSRGNLPVTTQEYRPDLLSWDLYGTTDLWSTIMIYNDMTSNEQILTGKIIRYPNLTDLEEMYFRLQGQQNAIEREQ